MVNILNRRRPSGLVIFLLLAACGCALGVALFLRPTSSPSNFSYQFRALGTVHVTAPAGEPGGIVLLISDSDGPGGRDAQVTASLTRMGFTVAGISLPEMRQKSLDAEGKCLSFVNSFDNLSKDVQHRTGIKSYLQPVIAGIGEGGALAYIVNQQSAVGLYRATVSLGFSPQFRFAQPLCHVATREQSAARWTLVPVKSVPAPWIVLASAESPAVGDGFSVAKFVGAVKNARLVMGAPSAGEPIPAAMLSGLFEPLLKTAVAGLPITEITEPGAPVTDTMAVFYSGDGGWTGLNQQIATQLAKKGVPTIGVSSLEYFWSARTPGSAAGDLDRIIRTYGRRWKRNRVIVIGYSFGADVLPFVYSALPPDSRSQVVRLSLLGLGDKADFQFHLGSWLDISGDDALPTVPAVAGLTGVNVQCIRGTTEKDNVCPDIPAGKAEQVLLPGDHHFDGNAGLIARTFLTGISL